MHAAQIRLVLGRGARAEADGVAEVIRRQPRHHRVQIDHAHAAPGLAIQQHVVELGVVVGDAQGDFARLHRVQQRVHLPLVLPAKLDFRRHAAQPAGLVARNRVFELAVARRGVVEIVDRLMQRIRRKAAHLPLEFAERLAGKLEQRGRVRQIVGYRVLNEQIHPPQAALPVVGEAFSPMRLHKGQRLARRIAALPLNLHLEERGHVLRPGEDIAVDALENKALLPRRDQIRLVDVAVAVRLRRPRAVRKIKLHHDVLDMWIHVVALSVLTLHAAGGQPLGEVLFNAHEQNDDRDGRQQRRREEVLPLDHVKRAELGDAHGDRLVRRGGNEHGGDRVFVPRVDEHEDQRRHNARRGHRQQNVPKRADRVAAVDAGGLLHLRGDRNECAAQQPDGERLVEGRVNQHQTQDRIVEVQRVHQLGNADQQHHRREHLAHNDEAEKQAAPLEMHARHRVGRRNTAEHRDGRRAGGEHDGIEQEAQNAAVADILEVAPNPLRRHHVQEVHIRRLREKIETNPSEPKYVHTKWGVGYYFQA